MRPFKWSLVAVFSLAVLLMAAGSYPSSPQPAGAALLGDMDCDSDVDAVDGLKVLRAVAGLGELPGCAAATEIDCDGDTDTVDGLRLLRYVGGLSNELPLGCPQIQTVSPDTPTAEAASQLADQLLASPNLLHSVESVEQVLARSGVASGDGEGEVYIPATEPAAASVAIPLETLHLAYEARTKGAVAMTAAELGEMLADFGWPFPESRSPGDYVIDMLAELVTGAQATPGDPNSFNPLFLQAIAQGREPIVNLADGRADPEEVPFTFLELQVLVASFDRQAVYPEAPAAVVPAASTPCTDAKKVVSGQRGPFAGQVHGLLTSQLGPAYLKEALSSAGVSAASVEATNSALGALGTAAKIWKLASFYANAEVSVEVQGGNLIHKPLDTDPGPLLKEIKGSAGVSAEDWQAYVNSRSELGEQIIRSVRDCLNEFGMAIMTDMVDVAADAENWTVEWTLTSGENSRGVENSTWSPRHQIGPGSPHLGKWSSSLQRTSAYAAGASFVIDIGTETQPDHETGRNKYDAVQICADVIAGSPPNLQTFFNATQGLAGLIDALVEIGAGWLQTVATPQSCATLGLTYHDPGCGREAERLGVGGEGVGGFLPCRWEGTVSVTDTVQYPNLDSTLTLDGDLTWRQKSEFPEFNDFSISCEYDPQPCTVYFASGTVDWDYDHWVRLGDEECVDKQSGSFTVSPPSRERWWEQALFVRPTDSGVSYWGHGYTYDGELGVFVQGQCYQGQVQIGSWFITNEADGLRVSEDGRTISGESSHVTDKGFGSHSYEWEFHATDCVPSPEPICALSESSDR